MYEPVQLSLDYPSSDAGQIKPVSHGNAEAVNPASFDFEKLFDRKLKCEAFCNGSSMAVLGDCLDVLKEIKSKSINLIFADSPYNIGKDFGNNADKWNSVQEYVAWCKLWISECMRVLRDDGTMYFMTATQHMPYLDIFASENYNVLCRIVWTYDSSGVQSRKIYGSLYEPILMINKNAKARYTFERLRRKKAKNQGTAE